jgi:hypothetical protein
MDVTCAWCGEPWDVYGLRHDGHEYLSRSQAANLGVPRAFQRAETGAKEAQRHVSQRVYQSVLRGKGCPDVSCGFDHEPGDGPYREQQLAELVVDGVTDDDPALFM